jgi:3'(2'), 5'-bisphosphate nucleotidase
MAYTKERAAAVEAVKIASALCQCVQGKIQSVGSVDKKDKSPVTIADFGTQAVVSELLFSRFPDLPLVGEEDAGDLRSNKDLCQRMMNEIEAIGVSLTEEEALVAIDRGMYAGGAVGRHWTLDPIDGTKGFLRGDQYAIALALIEDGKVVLGVLGCPNLPVEPGASEKGVLFVAVEGEGAKMIRLSSETMEETDISVAKVADISSANFCESVEAAHSSHSDSAKIAQLLGIEAEPFRIDSQCKYAAVGRGDASIYLRLPTRPGYIEKIWDHAAGVRVILEAGGMVTDIYGKELDFSLGRGLKNNKGVIVSNGQFHSQILSAIREVLDL